MSLFEKLKSEVLEHVSSPVKVLGSGCKACDKLEEIVVAALKEVGIDFPIEHVTDPKEIAEYGVMKTPALVVNGKVVASGDLIKKEEVIEFVKDLLNID